MPVTQSRRYDLPSGIAGAMCLFAKLSIVILALLVAAGSPANAKSLPLVRDAEIEGLMKSYTGPIFRAAGLNTKAIDVYLVNNPTFNAFVTGRSMFFHTGALMQSDTPNEIIGVIAHETGHIVGGHQERMRARFEKAQILATIGLLMGAGAMTAGGDLGDAAGQALIQGGGTSLRRALLSYQRDEESAADRAALSLLEKSGQSARGMINTFKRMGSQLLFTSSRPDPYVQSHPLPRARISLLDTKAKSSSFYNVKDPTNLQLRHDMMRAKIAAYTGGLGAVRNIFKGEKNHPAARYGTAISMYLRGNSKSALKVINSLLKSQPKNAYVHEMKAEILLRAGQPEKAVKHMQTAIKLDPYKSGLLRIQYGHVLLETRTQENLKLAIKELKAGLGRDPKTVSGYVYLARAYSAIGQEGKAMAATAEQNFLLRNYKEAKRFAKRAQQNLNKNSPEWLRMQDIVLYKIPKRK